MARLLRHDGGSDNSHLLPSEPGNTALAVCVLGAFTAVTAMFFPHWSRHINSVLLGPREDNRQDYWNTWYGVTKASGHFFFTNLIRYPTGTPLYYQSFDYPQIAVVALLARIFGTAPSTLLTLQNITLLASFPLAGTGAFFLVRHYTRDILGASLGGFVFAFSPWHVAQAMHHAHVSSIEFIPMFVLAYTLALERKSIGWLGAAVALCVLNALSCWYYLVYIGFFLVFHFVYWTVQKSRSDLGWAIGAPLACIVGTLAILSPLVIPMASEALHGGAVYADPEGSKRFVADLAAYFIFPSTHVFSHAGMPAYLQPTGNPWEGAIYLGLVNLALLTWALLRSRSYERSVFVYLLAGMASFVVIASGDELHLFGHRLMAMPGALISQLPLLANARTPSRAVVFVYLFLSVGVGLAMRLAFERYPHVSERIGLYCVLVLLLIDFFPAYVTATPAECKPGWARIRDDGSVRYGILMLPRGFIPMRDDEDRTGYSEQVRYMYEQATCHGRPIVEGALSRNVAGGGLLEALNVRDLNAQKKQLADAAVKYIVIDHDFRWENRDGDRNRYSLAYPTVYDGKDLTILRVY